MDFGILRALKTLKNHPYVQYVGLGFAGLVQQTGFSDSQEADGKPQRKTKLQLIRLSAAVCGIELCYAAETAFVSPILLKLGVPVSLMTLVWCLSPVLGFFLVPVMGSLSDRCPLTLGRRRPFILVMSVGIVVGLVLVPNGEALGLWMGDNGTATLHHPKYFTPYNLSLSPNSAHKRPSLMNPLPLHAGSVIGPRYLHHLLPPGRQGEIVEEDFNQTYKKKPVSPQEQFRGEGSKKSKTLHGAGDRRMFLSHKREVWGHFGRMLTSRPRRSKRQSLSEQRNVGRNVQSKPRPAKEVKDSGGNIEEDEDDSSSRPLSVFQLSEEHFRGIILTILGVALLDFNCDACQSPCRAYLLDVSIPEDHSSGLTMFTVMAGLGGTVGYVMGGIDWNATSFGEAFGGHIRVVFTLVMVVFVVCVASTITSFKETPLHQLGYNEEQLQKKKKKVGKSKYRKFTNEDSDDDDDVDHTEGRTIDNSFPASYGAVTNTDEAALDKNDPFSCNLTDVIPTGDDTMTFYHAHDLSFNKPFPLNGSASTEMPEADRGISSAGFPNHTTNLGNSFLSKPGDLKADTLALDLPPAPAPIEVSADVTLKTYLRSILRMPRCMWVLCLVNLFCWMSLVCYSLYFTDFVGQAVFMGDPQAPPGSPAHNAYDDGVRLGSFGMSLYSLSCSVYSLLIEKLVRRYRAKNVYVTGQLVFTVGMAVMAAARHKVAVVLLSPTAGIMYATLFTMPYLLVAHYHTSGLFSHGGQAHSRQVRGLGTDVAIVSSMVFLAQFLLSVAMGTIIYALSSTTTVIVASAVLSSLGALTATQVTYLDL